MSTLANANTLFQGLKVKPSFSKSIHIRHGDAEDVYLRSVRKKIRKSLREAFSNLQMALYDSHLRSQLMFGRDDTFLREAKLQDSFSVSFLTQGSHAYNTLIRPEQKTVQEIDLDDGVYFPVPFINNRPMFSSKGLFLVLEKALENLIETEGWKVGKRKNTCYRIKLPHYHAHIDLPIFAVKKEEFQRIQNQLKNRLGDRFNTIIQDLDNHFMTDSRDLRLKNNQILLAHREKDWIESDPKEVQDWFEKEVQIYGPVLKRLCRYLKAWRDYSWANSSMTSLALMTMCINSLGEINSRPSENRDDLLLLEVIKLIPKQIRIGNIVWKEGTPALDDGWDEDREEYAIAMEKFANEMSLALNNTRHKDLVVKKLQSIFGNRIPNHPDAVIISPSLQISAILETKASSVSLPSVGTSISG